MKEEVTALKAHIVSMERTRSSIVRNAVKVGSEERTRRRDSLERRHQNAYFHNLFHCITDLQNELLTEMVAAEQVNVKLQERRNEALKWELLRQGGCQEKFDSIAKEVPNLADTLRADTNDVLHGLAKHDMAEAVEHVVCGIRDAKEDLQEAFLARDTGRTGALGGSAFKDALKETFPDMPREDRQLLMLRFVREVDQSVDYREFLDFCSHKAESRERLKMGLTGALAATRFGATLSNSPRRGASQLAATLPAQGTQGQRAKPFFATALMLSRPESRMPTENRAFDGFEERSRRGTGRTDSIFTQGTVDPAMETAVQEKVAALVSRRGAELEALLQARDPGRSGEVRVKAFSECLRVWDSNRVVERSANNGGGGGIGSKIGGNSRGDALNDTGSLTHADRKVLYKRWTVKGQVKYTEFLRESGHRSASSAPKSRAMTAATPARLSSLGKRETRHSLGARGSVSELVREEEEEERELLARARVVLVHLAEVLEDEGEESYFAAFEDQDGDNRRRLDEDGFIDAMGILAPEVTADQVHDVFRVRSRAEKDQMVDYDTLFKDLRESGRNRSFQSGDAVELRVKKRDGSIEWVPAQVISKDEDGTYTVRFRSSKAPGGTGGRIKESGILESDMREARQHLELAFADLFCRSFRFRHPESVVSLDPPKKREAKAGAFLGAIALWVANRSKRTKRKAIASPPSLLSRLLGRGSAMSEKGSGKKTKKSREKSSTRKRTSERRRSEVSSCNEVSPARARTDSAIASELTPRRQSPTSRSSSNQHRHHPRRHRRGGTNPLSPSSMESGGTGGVATWAGRGRLGWCRSVPTPSRKREHAHLFRPEGRQAEHRLTNYRTRFCRRVVELPVIREGSSLPAGTSATGLRRESSRKKRAPVSGGNRRSSEKGERRNSVGLKSLETLERSNIEDKFDLYKKRTKSALSPDKRGSGTV
ncbi:unnamed protein product, partial [Scytosiphon promiscuus]